jgi:hypothetical protein
MLNLHSFFIFSVNAPAFICVLSQNSGLCAYRVMNSNLFICKLSFLFGFSLRYLHWKGCLQPGMINMSIQTWKVRF